MNSLYLFQMVAKRYNRIRVKGSRGAGYLVVGELAQEGKSFQVILWH